MLASLVLLLSALRAPVPPVDGHALVRAMHDRYAGHWYRSVTFVQTTTLADGRLETWYEAAALPGRLRIDIGPDTAHTVLLFSGDSIYQFQGGAAKLARPFVHPLMVLGFDVYAQPVERTEAQLTSLGFDLSRLHEDTWQGRPVYVVGAAKGDTASTQFWVDQERLVFVRMLQRGQRDTTAHIETQFNKYQPLGGGWIAAEVRATVNGEVRQLEEYHDITADPALPADLWDAGKLPPATWMQPSR
ncbi:MAG TPA: hypothetical protein VFS28_00350 [Gemmatimonadales bacterium]|jgi:hypothetical protein|nr:hypothetical protein [Gemmatimonadales bacterium]